MKIIHIGYTGGLFLTWAERSITPEDSNQNGQWHPFCLNDAELRKTLARLGLETDEQTRTLTATVKLPSCSGMPMPSSKILGDFDTEELELQEFNVPAIPLTSEHMERLKQLSEHGRRLSIPGIMPGNDAIFMIESFKYASLLALRGCFIPYMRKTAEGCFSCWEPIYLPKYHHEYTSYLNSIPPVLKGFRVGRTAAPEDSEKLGRAILERFIDGIIRTAQTKNAKGRLVNIDNTHEMWLRSLTWARTSLTRWNEEMRSVYPQITAWAEEAKIGSGEPWRLLLRIEEPEHMDNDTRWLVTWHIQALRDESIIIPASRVWKPTATERAWFDMVGKNPRKFLLQTLGMISAYVPPIEDALYEASPVSCEFTANQMYDFMTNALPRLSEDGVHVLYPKAWGSPEDRERFSLSGKLADNANFTAKSGLPLEELLDVNWHISLGGELLTDEEIKTLIEIKTPFVQLHGKTIFVDKDELSKIISKINELPKQIDRRSALLSTLSGTYEGMRLSSMQDSNWLDNAIDVLTGKEQLPALDLPEHFNGTLRPYQLRGLSWLDWLTKLGLGGCLADDMGLGKTVETLALLQQQKNEGKTGPVLLVCPTSVVENWRLEAARFTPQLRTYIHYGMDRLRGEKFLKIIKDKDVIITSYSLLSRDFATITRPAWRGAILDEAQNIKNPLTRQSKTAHSITADWRLALTGTPVENHVGDLWSVLKFCVPGLLPNKSRFAREYLRPIQNGKTQKISKLRLMTGPFILRRVKTDKEIISDLPDKIETREFCPLSKEQATLYAAVVNDMEKRLHSSKGLQRKGLVLTTITTLKEICDHPALYLKDDGPMANRSGKLARISELTDVMLSAGDRTLIFTQYASMGRIIKNYLQETFGTEVLFLHGGVTKEKRDELIHRFAQPDGPRLFVLSLKAGGTGLNLTNANHVIMFDRWWNPAVEQQAVDRAYRIGQKRNVQVHYFCCNGTLEEKIEQFISSKQQVAEAVVQEGENWLTELTDDELHELFALNIVEEENE